MSECSPSITQVSTFLLFHLVAGYLLYGDGWRLITPPGLPLSCKREVSLALNMQLEESIVVLRAARYDFHWSARIIEKVGVVMRTRLPHIINYDV